MLFPALACLTACLLSPPALALDPTDTIMNGDTPQSGYLPNHNMDPAIIGGGSFGQIWRYTSPKDASGSAEQFYAVPLVYTPSSTGRQVVIAASELNKLYVLDAVNGTLYASRNLGLEGEPPFLVSDLGGCNDISDKIGITGTPVIDPTTDTMYFYAKSYLGAQKGYTNGAYRFHAVDVMTLKEKPGFPVNIQGLVADNDNSRWFTGGTQLQRVSLSIINSVVYAGFGGHCDFFNFTGWVVGMSTSGTPVTAYTSYGGSGAPPMDNPPTFQGGGGGAGIWQSGNALASDNTGRLFFTTGNGVKTRVNNQQPASGRVHLDTLSECVVNMKVSSNGTISQQDYFEPAEYMAMDNGDRDLGSGGVCLPDPSVFSGGSVARMAISIGKNGKAYVMNADNLGGYKLGAGGSDGIIQTLTMPGGGAVFGLPGSYPLEGGYLYITPVGYPTQVYGLGSKADGTPQFTYITQTDESSSGRVGVGPATITTLKGKPGTGVLWIVDVDSGIRAYQAVPVNGKMIRIPLPASPSVSKFQRPAFGDGRYYLSTTNGNIIAYGSPVNLPLNCTSPLDFGSVTIGNSSTLNISCTATIGINSIQGFIPGKTVFVVKNSSLPTGPIKAGAKFSFPVLFNLTGYQLSGGSSSAPSVTPGVQTTSIGILTNNSVTGYSTETPFTVTGQSVSPNGFISMSPLQVDFAPIVLGSAGSASGSDDTYILSNIGSKNLTITGVAWTDGTVIQEDDDDPPDFYNVTRGVDPTGAAAYVFDPNGYFTSVNLPRKGTIIAPGKSITANVKFSANATGSYSTSLYYWSDGGNAFTIFTGQASTPPLALLEYSLAGGPWVTIPNCQNPSQGCASTIDFGSQGPLVQSSLKMRFSNTGGSALTVTKSKPPEGSVIGASNPNTDFSEGSSVLPGRSENATVFFNTPNAVLNANNTVYSAIWTLNVNDLNFGVHVLNFTGTQVNPKVGPADSNGNAIFQYLGCYLDRANNGQRLEPTGSQDQKMTNGACQNLAYQNGNAFAGTEYQTECWRGSLIPNSTYKVQDSFCSYSCGGDASQACGGDGGYISIFYDSRQYTPGSNSLVGGMRNPGIPSTVAGFAYAGCYMDPTNNRTLSGQSQNVNTNTLQSCATYCAGYQAFGTEYGSECYCGNTLNPANAVQPDSDCNMACAGNQTQFCGAGNRLQVYKLARSTTTTSSTSTSSPTGSTIPTTTTSTATPTPTPTGPTQPPIIGNYTFLECHSDNTTIRTLNEGTGIWSPDLTLERCASQCAGYTYFGTEYSRECYCGNTLSPGSFNTTDGRCTMTCNGNASQYCGGPDGLSLYGLTSIFGPNTTSSSSTTSSTTTSSSSSSATPPPVTTSTNTKTTSVNSTLTSTPTTTPVNSTVTPTTTPTTTPATTTTTPSSISTPTTSTPTATPTPWNYLGCANDTATTIYRALSGSNTTSTSMTLDSCFSLCGQNSYALAGLLNGNTCACGMGLAFGSTLAYPNGCKKACAGNTKQFCGGASRLAVYNFTNTLTTRFVPYVGPYNSFGCYRDADTANHVLSNYTYTNTTAMSVESCVTTCRGKGYLYAGVENGNSCFCGTGTKPGAIKLADSKCQVAKCTGSNGREWCGGPQQIYIYHSSTTTTKRKRRSEEIEWEEETYY